MNSPALFYFKIPLSRWGEKGWGRIPRLAVRFWLCVILTPAPGAEPDFGDGPGTVKDHHVIADLTFGREGI